jgi:hypothetical protein
MRESQVTAPSRNCGQLLDNPLALGHRRRVDVSGSATAISHASIVMECGASCAKQSTVPTCGRASNWSGVYADDGNARVQEFIDAREPAPTEPDDASIGVNLASERGIRRAGVSIPDGRCRTQK